MRATGRISESCNRSDSFPGSMGVPPVWALVWQRKPVSKQARRLFSLLFATFGDAPRVTTLIFFLAASWLHADGGRPVGQADAGGLRVTLFSASLPVRAGAFDAGVLIQEIPSNRPVADASVTLSARNTSPAPGRPVRMPAWCSSRDPGSEVPATSSHSANKLLLGAYLPLTGPGRWEITVSIRRGEAVTRFVFPLDVAPPAPPLGTWWPLVALVPLAIAAYAWRTTFARPRRPERPEDAPG